MLAVERSGCLTNESDLLANQSIVIFTCVLVAGVGGADAGGGEQHGWWAKRGGPGSHCSHHHCHASPRHHQGSLTQVLTPLLSLLAVFLWDSEVQ